MTNKTCTLCNGSGNDGYHKDEECPLCDGTKKIDSKTSKKSRRK